MHAGEQRGVLVYVIISPCVYDQSLRAEGITTPADCDVFSRCRERCHAFHIQTIRYRCPETSYFGKHRQPSSFEEMSNPGFSLLLDEIETEIREYINQHGKPAAIVGVDSSPICGICYTYQTSLKRSGRGALLARFLDIRAVDVKTFACYRTLLIHHQNEQIQPIIECLTTGKLLVTTYEIPGQAPPTLAYDLAVLTDPVFFPVAQNYCHAEHIMTISDHSSLSPFFLS
jgi:predicted secreted protein